jgi:hypothetical protein
MRVQGIIKREMGLECCKGACWASGSRSWLSD